MANLTEGNVWVDGIYQLEEDDPVTGGPNGIDNWQALALGSRTRYLKAAIEQLVTAVITASMKSTQEKAIAGTDDSSWMTPLRVAQAITALASITAASEAAAGKVELATIAETIAGTDTQRATHPAGVKAAITQAVAELAGTVPEYLDTLAEFAAALGNDPNFSTTVLNAVAQRVSISSKATLAQAIAGTDDTTWMTPLKVAAAIAEVVAVGDASMSAKGKIQLATSAIAAAFTDNAMAITPMTLAAALGIRVGHTFSQNDWIELPGGLKLQYQLVTECTSITDYRYFPIAFDNACFGCFPVIESTTTGGFGANYGSVVKVVDNAKFVFNIGGQWGGGGYAYVLAIGK